MGRAPNERVTRDVAQEICLRTGSKAMLLRLDFQPWRPVRGRRGCRGLQQRRHAGQGTGGGCHQSRTC